MAIITFPEKYRMGKLKRRFNKGNKARYRLSEAGGGPSTAGFNPASVADLRFWFKADAIVGLNDSDPVSQWDDSSGNSNHITQGTAANRPLYKNNVRNSLPAVLFDGSNDSLTKTSGATVLPSNQAYTAFVAASVFDTGVARTLTECRSSTDADPVINGLGQDFAAAGADNLFYLFHRNDTNPGAPQKVTGAQISGWHLIRSSWDGTTGRLFVDNVEQGSGATFSQSASTINQIWVGINQDTGGGFWKDYIGEILFYNRALIAQEVDDITNHLSGKWNISI